MSRQSTWGVKIEDDWEKTMRDKEEPHQDRLVV
jgi:hypothetical protein